MTKKGELGVKKALYWVLILLPLLTVMAITVSIFTAGFHIIKLGIIVLYFLYTGFFINKINKIEDEIAKYDNFLKNGKLIKDIPFIKHNIIYRAILHESSSSFVAVVDYQTIDGKTLTLGRFEKFPIDKYGDRNTIDLYIDEENPENYIIGFDLEEQKKNNELY